MFNDEGYRNAVLGYTERRLAMKTTGDERPQTMCEAGTCGHQGCRERLWAKGETTSETQVHAKHAFEPFPTDSSTCRFCQQPASGSLHANVPTTQPAAGEREEWAWTGLGEINWRQINATVYADHFTCTVQGDRLQPGEAEAIATHIVRNHATAGLMGELVTALELAAKRIDFLTNWIENAYSGSNRDVELGRQYAEATRHAARKAGVSG